jgi:hypothetical protein
MDAPFFIMACHGREASLRLDEASAATSTIDFTSGQMMLSDCFETSGLVALFSWLRHNVRYAKSAFGEPIQKDSLQPLGMAQPGPGLPVISLDNGRDLYL